MTNKHAAYKNTIYCPFWQDCANGEYCDAALNDGVRLGAKIAGQTVLKHEKRPVCFTVQSFGAEEKPND